MHDQGTGGPAWRIPLTYQGLVVERTSRCNAKCAMCYQDAGAKGSGNLGSVSLSVADISRVLREAHDISTLRPRFHLAGGEGWLQWAECFTLFAAARELGYLEITTTTNCFWAFRLDQALVRVAEAAASGLTSMEISWDHWHMPYIRPVAVGNALRACRELGVTTNLRVLTTTDHDAAEALGYLDADDLRLADEISSSPVYPTGRAAKELDPATIWANGSLGGSCHSVLNLTVNAAGRVAPCCAGADQTEGLTFGSVLDESIVDIARRMQSSLLLKVVTFNGVGSLIPLTGDAAEDLAESSSICHACWTIFSDPELTRRVGEQIDRIESEAFAGFADHVERASATWHAEQPEGAAP